MRFTFASRFAAGFTGRFGHVSGTFSAILEFSAAPRLASKADIPRRINDLRGIVLLPQTSRWGKYPKIMPPKGTLDRSEGANLPPSCRQGHVLAPYTGRFGHVFRPESRPWDPVQSPDVGAHVPPCGDRWRDPNHPIRDRKGDRYGRPEPAKSPEKTDGTARTARFRHSLTGSGRTGFPSRS